MMKYYVLMLSIVAVSSGAASAETAKLIPQAQALSEFGKCILGQAPEKSKALMATSLNTPQEYKLARQLVLANNGCVKKYASLSMQTGQIRGAIAETILVSDAGRMKQFASAPLRLRFGPNSPKGARLFIAMQNVLQRRTCRNQRRLSRRCTARPQSVKRLWLMGKL